MARRLAFANGEVRNYDLDRDGVQDDVDEDDDRDGNSGDEAEEAIDA